MSAAAFFRLKKLKGGGTLLAAARHNRRAIQSELGADSHINPSKSHLNETLCGASDPEGVAQRAKEAMQAAGVGKLRKLRKDAVVAVEAVFSLPAGHPIDQRQYFVQCLAWAEAQFGGASNILSADIHHDEAQPHLHVLVLPLVNGRMVGSDMVGNLQALQAMQVQFFKDVAQMHGLTQPPARMTGAHKAEAAERVIASMKASNDPALKSTAWAVIRDAIESDPAPFMAALGVNAPQKTKRAKSSTAIFTSPGKGPKRAAEPSKPIGFQVKGTTPAPSNPIGFQPPEKDQTLSCVGFAQKTVPVIEETATHNTPHQEQDNDTAGDDAANYTEDQLLNNDGDANSANLSIAASRVKAGAVSVNDAPPAVVDALSAAEDTVRVRDDDMPVDCWDADTGTFQTRPVRQTQQKAAAVAWVSEKLKSLKAGALDGQMSDGRTQPTDHD